MARRPVGGPWAGWNPLLALIAVVAFVWGLERWRRDAAQRAGRSERARVVALAKCLLGPDGATLMRSPQASRERLRALAMDTAPEASVTWLDRCVSAARALARHAGEVDNSGALTDAQTRVADRTRALAEAVSSTGLVWRVRSGDPDADMDLVAESLARAAAEIDLAGAPQDATNDAQIAAGVPVAPAPRTLPRGALVPTPGLEPSVVGGPARFFAGAPMPSVVEVGRDEDGAWRIETLANEPSLAFRAGGESVVRIDALVDPSDDGLAPLRLFRPGEPVAEARVTPVNDPLEGARVALDAVTSGSTLWLAEWTPWNGTVLARFAPGRAATALELAQPPARGTPQAATDERIAIAPLGAGAVVAFTGRRGPESTVLSLATTLADRDRAPVERIAWRELAAREPSLEFCARNDGSELLLVAGSRAWLALRVDPTGTVTDAGRVDAPAGHAFDERAAVRCAPDGAVVAFGREHPRSSPVLVCPAGAPCASVEPADVPLPATLPLYTTRTSNGRALAHGEWPVVFALAGPTLVAARAVGGIVAVARRPAAGGAWEPERVVFDAAARAHGELVAGLGVYSDRGRVTVAAGASDGLHVFASDDAAAGFH